MDVYKRHDLVWISDEGKKYALRHIQSRVPPVSDTDIRALIFSSPPIPAIVRRQETARNAAYKTAEPGLLQVGFSSPHKIDGIRIRIASEVPLDCIISHKTPFDVANCEKKYLSDSDMLEALMDAGRRYHTQVGCFGSVALQIVTGLPYRTQNSDLDIYLRHQGNREELAMFFQALLELEKQFGVVIDVEIEYLGQYGVKLKELFGPGKTILGKGIRDVVLLPKTRE